MNAECFALLDDASAPEEARSRLYTGHVATLVCRSGSDWPRVLREMQHALASGLHAVALCAYELGAHLQGIALPPADAEAAPLARIVLFGHCRHMSQAQVDAWLAETDAAADAAPAGIAAVHADVGQGAFEAALARIHAYIEAGDAYQVNYTYRLHFDAFGSLRALYARLRARQPVPYGALVALADGSALLSLSPELFVRHEAGKLTAQPMKGTAVAAPPGQLDDNARRAQALALDPKNRAENLMIVDLLRNDLGRIAVTGSVAVPALFEVRRFGSVLQMTSTVSANLRCGATLADIFTALYPCGSITGAPKRRSMEIIGELEAAARGIYTGAIGWFEPPAAGTGLGNFCLSVPIRTLALQAPDHGVRRGEMGVGAGIVFDSDAREEYEECRLKAEFLTGLAQPFELFETMHATRTQGCRLRERHLARLAASAHYFGFAFDEALACAKLDAACAALAQDGPYRLRLGLAHSGALTVQSAALVPLTAPVRLQIAPDATVSGGLFLRHKTSVRARYDAAWRDAEAQGAFDTLFFNERGELTEGGRSNVFVKHGGRWYTPPLSCGLLPGVMRGALLADPAWGATERVVTRAMLREAQEVVVCNALRGPLKASLDELP